MVVNGLPQPLIEEYINTIIDYQEGAEKPIYINGRRSSMYLEELIKRYSPEISNQMTGVAKWAKSEMDLQIEVEKLLELFKKQAKIDLKAHHNITIGTGRPDSVYSSVIIEYKKPKRLSSSNSDLGNKEVIEQLKQRFADLEKKEKRPKNKTFGVGTDGFKFIFVRYRANDWEISEPVDVSTKTVEIFLRRLSSLGMTGKALLPEYLQGDFGEGSNIAEMAVQTLYKKIESFETAKASKLFEQWKVMFREVCGYDLESPKKHILGLGRKYGISGQVIPSNLLFAIHSYYAMFMKLLATEIVHFFYKMPAYLGKLNALTGSRLKDELLELEREGGIFKQLGITNFLEGDLLSWYLDEWDDNIESIMHSVIQRLQEYDPGTLTVEPQEARDLLKQLYQYLIDRPVRHDLGEYYTPDWLAELVLERVEYNGDPDKRILDPACGSGTFLVLIINRIREYAEENMIPPKELLHKILKNVVGFDLNPLAVMAARTNYLIALGDLLSYRTGDIEIPVYLCDSILTPRAFTTLYTQTREVTTSVGKFQVPICVVDKGKIGTLTDVIEYCVDNDYEVSEFLKRCKIELNLGNKDYERSKELLKNMFKKIVELKEAGINSIWSRFIKNAFAPVFKGKFDYVIGNPPWVNWENLTDSYKKDMKNICDVYELFPFKGWQARLGSAKYDISMVMSYVSIDKYLEPKGKLGFLITQSVFQSDAGYGFRRFSFWSKKAETKFKVIETHDMVDLQPFEDAANRTSAFIIEKGKKTVYPVPYVIWNKTEPINQNMSLQKVLSKTKREKLLAFPIEKNDSQSRWLVSEPSQRLILQKLIGKSDYKGLTGSYTEGANGVFWINIESKLPDGSLLVKNITKNLKRKVNEVVVSIEADWVYPLLRSGRVKKWSADPKEYIIFTSKFQKKDLMESRFKVKYRKTFQYFKKFEKELNARKSYAHKMKNAGFPFYTMYGSKHMYSPYKVVWQRMGSKIEAAVVSTKKDECLIEKPVIPQETIIFVPTSNENEAHYICALLNSKIPIYIVKKYSTVGGKSFASAHILNYIGIKKFDPQNKNHMRLSELSKKAHQLIKLNKKDVMNNVQAEIDKTAIKTYGVKSKDFEGK